MLLELPVRFKSKQARAIFLLLVSTVMFTGMAICIRKSALNIPIFEVVFFRNFLAAIIMVPILNSKGFGALKMNNPKLFFIRAFFGSIGMIAGFSALTLIPLAQVTAISFSTPIFLTIGAIFFLGEVVKVRRIIAIGVGFLGMLVIIQPGVVPISLGIVLAISAALCHSINGIVIKKLTRSESPDSIVAWMVIMLIPITLVPAIASWEWPNVETWCYLWMMALFGTLAHMSLTRAYSLTEITSLQPLEFVKLPLAAVVAWFIFSEVPGVWTWLGGIIIFTSTVYITHREVQVAKSSRPNHGYRESKF